MSLSNVEKNSGDIATDINLTSKLDFVKATSRVENDELTYEPFLKLKNHVTTSLANVDTADQALVTTKAKSYCSAQELDGIRREKNRMHAKQTRLRKKKMTQEMEVVSPPQCVTKQRVRSYILPLKLIANILLSLFQIISTLEREVGVLQSGLIAMLPEPLPVSETCEKNFVELEYPKSSNLIEVIEMNKDCKAQSFLSTRPVPVGDSFPASIFNRKRRHSIPSSEAMQSGEDAGCHQEETITKVLADRDTKLLWRQHISKNAVKTVSICSESNGSLSEGSGSEGGQGSAVHSLLHMGDSSSSHSRGSSSGSDDDSSSSRQNQSAVHSSTQAPAQARSYIHIPRATETHCITPVTAIATAHSKYAYPGERINHIQAILAACGPPLTAPQKQAHWRLPDRGYAFSSHTLAGPTAAAVASIYPTVYVENNDNLGPFKGYVPMRGPTDNGKATTDVQMHGVRNHDFTIYDGHRLRAMKDQ